MSTAAATPVKYKCNSCKQHRRKAYYSRHEMQALGNRICVICTDLQSNLQSVAVTASPTKPKTIAEQANWVHMFVNPDQRWQLCKIMTIDRSFTPAQATIAYVENYQVVTKKLTISCVTHLKTNKIGHIPAMYSFYMQTLGKEHGDKEIIYKKQIADILKQQKKQMQKRIKKSPIKNSLSNIFGDSSSDSDSDD
eukprot:452942_1